MSRFKQRGSEEFGFLIFLLIVLFVCSIVFEWWTSDYEHSEDQMNSLETAMMTNYTKQRRASDDRSTAHLEYVGTYLALYNVRYEGTPYNSTKPFCDIYDRVLLDELNIVNTDTKMDPKHLVSMQYFALTGIRLVDACTNYSNSPEPLEPPVAVVEEVVETSDPSGLISGEEYDRIFKSVPTCKRAAKTFMELTADGKFLTTEDSKVIAVTLQECDRYKLEKLINEG